MDSKVVTAALRESIHPLLKSVGGFTKLKARHAWRFDEHTTSVVNLGSFLPHLAESMGMHDVLVLRTARSVPAPPCSVTSTTVVRISGGSASSARRTRA